MNANPSASVHNPVNFEDQILEQGDMISKKLHLLSVQRFPAECEEDVAAVFAC